MNLLESSEVAGGAARICVAARRTGIDHVHGELVPTAMGLPG